MTTAYRYQDWRMGGSVPGKGDASAGNTWIPALDWLLTNGASPWTKTINSTYDITYTAPGGSQIAVNVYDDQSASTCLWARFRATVGGQTFPTPTQEVTSNMGYVGLRKAYTNSTLSTGWLGWYGWRTDRMFAMIAAVAQTSAANSGFIMAGDMPTYDPSDPGLCVLVGANGNTTFPNTSNQPSPLQSGSWQSSIERVGYAYLNRAANVYSVVCYGRRTGWGSSASFSLPESGNRITLEHCMLLTSHLQTTGEYIPRGWMPFIHPVPCEGLTMINSAVNVDTGDTFTDGTDTFEMIDFNGYQWAFAKTDSEPLP